jgi:hypothetical protein
VRRLPSVTAGREARERLGAGTVRLVDEEQTGDFHDTGLAEGDAPTVGEGRGVIVFARSVPE